MTRDELKDFFNDVAEFCNTCPYTCQGVKAQGNCLLSGAQGIPGKMKLNHKFLERLDLPAESDYEIIKRLKKPRKIPKQI